MESPIYRFGVYEFWLSETVFIQYSIHNLTYNSLEAGISDHTICVTLYV